MSQKVEWEPSDSFGFGPSRICLSCEVGSKERTSHSLDVVDVGVSRVVPLKVHTMFLEDPVEFV